MNKSTLLLVVVTLIFQVNRNEVVAQSKYGTGTDSINCIKNLSLYSEFYKQKNYSDAYMPWSHALKLCPQASKNLYIHGDKILKYKIAKEKDQKIKGAFVDSLLMLYDIRIENFGQKGFVMGRKGNAIMAYRPTNFEDAYKCFEESFNLSGKNTEAQIMVLFMKTTDALFKAEKIGKEKVIENYSKITDAIDQKIKDENDEDDIKAKNNIDIIFDLSGAASCESLVALYQPKFDADPNNIELLKKITTMLDKYECTESECFVKSSEQLYKLEPSAQSAYMLAKMFLKKGIYDKSTSYYKEAINLQTDSLAKSKYYYELCVLTHSQQSSPETARNYAYQALKYNPKDGRPYIMIGNIYAASAKNCGENEFEKSAVYWAVVDKFVKAKKVDNSLAEEANKLIATYSKYFPGSEEVFFQGYADGQEYEVGCWINEKTKVRFE